MLKCAQSSSTPACLQARQPGPRTVLKRATSTIEARDARNKTADKDPNQRAPNLHALTRLLLSVAMVVQHVQAWRVSVATSGGRETRVWAGEVDSEIWVRIDLGRLGRDEPRRTRAREPGDAVAPGKMPGEGEGLSNANDDAMRWLFVCRGRWDR